jgi:uncharacterized protein
MLIAANLKSTPHKPLINEVLMFPAFPEISLGVYAMALSVVFFAAIVQSSMGMGFGQVAGPLLLLINADFVPVPIIMMGMLVATMNAIKGRKQVVIGELGFSLAGRIAGSIAAGWLIVLMTDKDTFSLLFAGLILLAVALSLGKWRLHPNPKTLIVAGTASGFMGTITSVGAPPMGIVYQHSPGPMVRATLNAFFALGTVASLCALGWFGLLRQDHLMFAIALTPALLFGIWISKYLTSFVDRRFRKLVLGVCIVSSLAVIWDALA